MSSISIAQYFPFCRVNIFGQDVTEEKSVIYMKPDKRFKPICYICKRRCDTVHKWVKRPVRDLYFGSAQVTIECIYRQIICVWCNRILVEDLEFFEPFRRVTKHLARAIHKLCKVLTVQDVAEHFNKEFKKVIDRVRIDEFNKASESDKSVIKGSKYLLLKTLRT